MHTSRVKVERNAHLILAMARVRASIGGRGPRARARGPRARVSGPRARGSW